MAEVISTVPGVRTGWGESVRYDRRRDRLWFTDCANQTLHWIDSEPDHGPTGSMNLPSMLAGLVLTDGDELIGCLDDGLHVIDVAAGRTELLTSYPDELGDRANDAHADGAGNLVTGTLNLAPAPGSAWWYSASDGWRLLDDDIANTNGPNALDLDGEPSLVVGDTSAAYYAYRYDADAGTVGPRRVFADPSEFGDGRPDGSTVDADGGLWVAAVGGGAIARYTPSGLDLVIELPARNPTDLCFGGSELDRLFVTTIGGDGELDGALLAVDGVGVHGRPEPRFRLAG